jgi:hypothetical protein
MAPAVKVEKIGEDPLTRHFDKYAPTLHIKATNIMYRAPWLRTNLHIGEIIWELVPIGSQ